MALVPTLSPTSDVTAVGVDETNRSPSNISTSQWRTTSHFLIESDSLANLQMPVGSSSRIKYCSIDVSGRYIALGTNTGAIHIFNRAGLQYRLPACSDVKDGCIAQLAFSPVHDDILSLATTMGTVCVMQLNIDRNERPEILRTILDHKGSVVTALSWSSDGKNLYVGDDQGLVNRFFITATKNKPLFGRLIEFVFQLDSAIVQIDTLDSMVLVTCLTSTHIAYTSRKQCKKIGTKPRCGEYGSCFFSDPDGTNKNNKIYCARPGSRLWEVDLSGNVISTLQLKTLLDDRPPTKIVTLSNDKESFHVECGCDKKSSFSFQKLHFFSNKFLLTYCDQGLLVVSPSDVQVVQWTTSIRGVMQLRCYRNHAYVLFVDGTVRKFSLFSTTKLWQIFYAERQWLRCAWLSLNVSTCRATRTALTGLSTHLRADGLADLAETIAALAIKVPDGPADPDSSSVDDSTDYRQVQQPLPRSSFRKLESGIYCRVGGDLLDSDTDCPLAEENSTRTSPVLMSKTCGQTTDDVTVVNVDRESSLSVSETHIPNAGEVVQSGDEDVSHRKSLDCSIPNAPSPCRNGTVSTVVQSWCGTNVVDSVAYPST